MLRAFTRYYNGFPGLPPVDPRQFGAVYDGVTNDLPACQAAWNSVKGPDQSRWMQITGTVNFGGGTLWLNADGTPTGGALNGIRLSGLGRENGIQAQGGNVNYDTQIINGIVAIGAPLVDNYNSPAPISFGMLVEAISIKGGLHVFAQQRKSTIRDMKLIPSYPEVADSVGVTAGLRLYYSSVDLYSVFITAGIDAGMDGVELVNCADTSWFGGGVNGCVSPMRFMKGYGSNDQNCQGIRMLGTRMESPRLPLVLNNQSYGRYYLSMTMVVPPSSWQGANTDPMVWIGDPADSTKAANGIVFSSSSVNVSSFTRTGSFTAASAVVTGMSSTTSISVGDVISVLLNATVFQSTVASIDGVSQITLDDVAPETDASATMAFSGVSACIALGYANHVTIADNTLAGSGTTVDFAASVGSAIVIGMNNYTNPVAPPIIPKTGVLATFRSDALDRPRVINASGSTTLTQLDTDVTYNPTVPADGTFVLPASPWPGQRVAIHHQAYGGGTQYALTLDGNSNNICSRTTNAGTMALPYGYSDILTWSSGGPWRAAVNANFSETVTLGGSSIPANTCEAETTVTIPGVKVGQTAALSPRADPGSGIIWSARVSANDTVKVKLCNITAGSVTPTSQTYDVRVAR